MANLNDYLQSKLSLADAKGQLRALPMVAAGGADSAGPMVISPDGRRLINFSSNDYLALSVHPEVIKCAVDATNMYGTGARSSRLIGGHSPDVAALEAALAKYRSAQAALVFSSGYAANTGVISALMDANDLILTDKLAHACLLDGARLSGANVHRFAHNNVEHLEKLLVLQRDAHANCLIITESIFSMDGDVAPIDDLVTLAKHYKCWLMVDDAHGFGFSNALLAPVAEFDNGMVSGTLSKAAGTLGGYVAGSQVLVDYLVNHARSFMFSTGLPPGTVAAALKALEIVSESPELDNLADLANDGAMANLANLANVANNVAKLSILAETALTRARLFTELMELPPAQSPIVPYIIGDNEAALKCAAMLCDAGFYVQAIRPPTVPPGSARLRITFSAVHSEDDVRRLAACLSGVTSVD